MGIEGYVKWVEDKYDDCIFSLNEENIYTNICIDLNHILHNNLDQNQTVTEFLKTVEESLIFIFNNFFPQKRIIICVDGPAPYSKAILQRKRRNAITNIPKLPNIVSSLDLTPGSKFMDKLDSFLINFADKLKKQYNFIHPEIIISSSKEPDEGEVKIFKKLSEIYQTNDKTLIIGNDADLILMSVAFCPYSDIYLLMKFEKKRQIISINKLLLKHIKMMGLENINENIRSDFALISTLLGNDYLHKLKYITLESTWSTYYETYKMLNRTLIVDNKFDSDFMILFLHKIIKNKSNKFNVTNYNDTDVRNYLEGLLWCLNMYKTGKCSMYDYIYESHNGISPLDVIYFATINKLEELNVPTSQTKPLSFEYYTLLSIPYGSKNIIPKKYYKLMDNELKYMYEKELCKDCIEMSNKKKEINKDLKNKKKSSIELDELKERLKEINEKITIHNKIHKFDFSIDDIKKILKYV